MGEFLARLTADSKEAMRARDKLRLQVLRMLISEIKSDRERNDGELSNEKEMQVLLRGVKTRKDAVQQARDVGREDIAETEAAEIVVIESYLPKQMTGDELVSKVAELATEIGYSSPKDTGKFMKVWMEKYRGQAEGRAVQQTLKGLN